MTEECIAAKTADPLGHCEEPEATRQSMDCFASSNDTEGGINPGHDRLSAAINFSQELSESRLREMARAYRRRWAPAARAEKARLIQRIKPWTRATGPKFRRRAPLDLAINRALREQAAFVRCVNLGFYHAEAGRVILLKLAALLALLEWERIFVTQSDPCCNIAQQ